MPATPVLQRFHARVFTFAVQEKPRQRRGSALALDASLKTNCRCENSLHIVLTIDGYSGNTSKVATYIPRRSFAGFLPLLSLYSASSQYRPACGQVMRSEERRVGKERRGLGWGCHTKRIQAAVG